MTKVEGARLQAISVAVPEQRLTCSDFSSDFDANEIARITATSGISSLRVAKTGQTASDLCFHAATQLGDALGGVKGIVFVSQTPDYILPSTASVLQHRLGLSNSLVAYDTSSGCTGYIHGLFLASMLASSLKGGVLLLAGDTITKYVSPKDRSLRLIMGDAGSATLVAYDPVATLTFDFFTDGSRSEALIIPAGAARAPLSNSNQEITERENGNCRSDAHLFMDGLGIMKFALTDVAALISRTLLQSPKEFDSYIFHQANKFIVQALAKALKAPFEKTLLAVDGYGNTGPASIPVAICHSHGGTKSTPGLSLLAGFGVGLSAATAIVDLSATKIHSISEAG